MKRLPIFSILIFGLALASCSLSGTSVSSSSSSSSQSSSSSSNNSSSNSSSSNQSTEESSEQSSGQSSEESSIHTHSYSSMYQYDADYHWYPTTCGHDNEEGALNKEAHTYGEWATTKGATCTMSGTEVRYCTSCGYSQSQTIEPTGHTYSITWTSDETGHWHASTCGHEVIEGFSSHTFGDWIIDYESTEESLGSKHRTCSICSYTEKSSIPVLPHTHKYETSYTSDDDYHWHATTCGHDSETGVLNKEAHSYGEVVTLVEPTCTSEGSGTKTCSVCEHVKSVTLPMNDHNYSSTYSYNETTHWRECPDCEATTDNGEHTFGDWVITTEPDCEIDGIETRTCTVCSYSEDRTVDATGHTYSDEWTSSEYGHWHVASCGHNVQTDFAEHTYGEWSVTTEPSCETEGVETRVCSICGYEEHKAIAATGHSYSSTWSYDENTHWYVSTCEHSGLKNEEAEHAFGDLVTVTSATCTEEGSGYRSCSVCGYSKTEVIPATGHSYSGTYDYNGYQHAELTSCGHDDVEGVLTYEDHTYITGTSICSVCKFNYLQGVEFTLDETTNTYSVTGTNETFYSGDLDIVIPSSYLGLPVTEIGREAFRGITNIKKVTLPDTITEIGSYAFRECSGLTSINFPEGLTYIGSWTFYRCSALESVDFPSTLYYIGYQAFAYCSSLSELVIPDSVTSMGNYAFYFCESLTSLTLGTGLSAIPENAFCSAFVSSSTIEVSLVIPDTVVSIGPSAFANNTSLRYVDLGEGLYTITKSAFRLCTRLTNIVVPADLGTVEYGAFDSCSSLANVYYRGTENDKESLTIENNADDTMTNNNYFINATWNYYSETEPTTSGNYWRFVEGTPTVW